MDTVSSAETTGLDEVFGVLSQRQRRQLLTELYTRYPDDGEVYDQETLAAEAAAVDIETVPLEHIHLPKLADAGFIDWDRTRQVVRPGPRFDEIAPVIELLLRHRHQPPADWP